MNNSGNVNPHQHGKVRLAAPQPIDTEAAGRARMKCCAWYAPADFAETHYLMPGTWQ